MRRNSMGTSLKPAPGISGPRQGIDRIQAKIWVTIGGWRQLSCQRDARSGFTVALPKVEVMESLAFLLLAVAALLLPLDVAARRLVISRGDRRAWSEALQRRESKVPAAVEPTLERLKERLEKGR